jgi:hypothetical protein
MLSKNWQFLQVGKKAPKCGARGPDQPAPGTAIDRRERRVGIGPKAAAAAHEVAGIGA